MSASSFNIASHWWDQLFADVGHALIMSLAYLFNMTRWSSVLYKIHLYTITSVGKLTSKLSMLKSDNTAVSGSQ